MGKYTDMLDEIDRQQAGGDAATTTVPDATAPEVPVSEFEQRVARKLAKKKLARKLGSPLTQREESIIDNYTPGSAFGEEDLRQSERLLKALGVDWDKAMQDLKTHGSYALEKPTEEELSGHTTLRQYGQALREHKGWTAPIANAVGVGMMTPEAISSGSLAPFKEGALTTLGMATQAGGPSLLGEAVAPTVNKAINRVYMPPAEGIKSGGIAFGEGRGFWKNAYEAAKEKVKTGRGIGTEETAKLFADIRSSDDMNVAAKTIAGTPGAEWLTQTAIDVLPIDPLLALKPLRLGALSRKMGVTAEVVDRMLMKAPEALNALEDALKTKMGVAVADRYTPEMISRIDTAKRGAAAFADQMKAEGELLDKQQAFNERVAGEITKKAERVGAAADQKMSAQMQALKERGMERTAWADKQAAKAKQAEIEAKLASLPVKDKAKLLRKASEEIESAAARGETRSASEIADDLATTEIQNEKIANYLESKYGEKDIPYSPLGRPLSQTELNALHYTTTPNLGPMPQVRGMRRSPVVEERAAVSDYVKADMQLPKPPKPQIPGLIERRVTIIGGAEKKPRSMSVVETFQKKAEELATKNLGGRAQEFSDAISDIEKINGVPMDPIQKSALEEKYRVLAQADKADAADTIYKASIKGNAIDEMVHGFGTKVWDDTFIGRAWKKIPRMAREWFVRAPDTAIGEKAALLQDIADQKKAIVGEQMSLYADVLAGRHLAKSLSEEEKSIAWALSQGMDVSIPAGVRTAEVTQVANEARNLIDRAGEVFVKIVPEEARKVLTNEKFLKEHGVYMPRYYKKFGLEKTWEEGARKYLDPAFVNKYLGHRTMARTLNEKQAEYMKRIKSPVVAAKGSLELAHDAFTYQFYADIKADAKMAQVVPKGSEAPKGFIRMPENEKAASLSSTATEDVYVHPDVYYLLRRELRPDATGASKMIGQVNDFLMGIWKPSMTVLNPTSYAHNAWGALSMNAAGTGRIIGSPKMAASIAKSTMEFATKADIAKQAAADGVFKGNWAVPMSSQAKRHVHEAVISLTDHGEVGIIEYLKRMRQSAAIPYTSIDDINKLNIYEFALGQGMGRREAALYARKWGIDWDRAGSFIKWLGRGPVPFISYSALAIPRYLEASLKFPLATNAHGLAMMGMSAVGAQTWGFNDSDKKTEAQILQGDWYAHRSLFRLPWGKPGQYADASYIVPWGVIAGNQSLRDMVTGSPYWTILEGMTNWDIHANRKIWDDRDPDSIARKKLKAFLGRRWLPGILPGGYFHERAKAAVNQTPDYLGRVKTMQSFVEEVAMGYREVNVDFAKELQRIRTEDQYRASYLRTQMNRLDKAVREKKMDADSAASERAIYQAELDGLARKTYPSAPGLRTAATPSVQQQIQKGMEGLR